MKRIVTAAMFALAMCTALHAQDAGKTRNYKLTPYMFVGLQGGATRTFTNAQLDRQWAPMGAVSVGAYFTPWLGARLQGNGWMWDQNRLGADGTYNTKQYGGDVDLLLNLSGLLFHSRNNFLGVVLLGGYGMQYAKFEEVPTAHMFPLSDVGNRWMHAGRLGGQLDLNIAKHVGVQIEGGYMLMHDHMHGFKVDKWWPYAMLGLNYKFGHPRVSQPVPAVVPVVQEVVEQQQAPVAPAAPVVEEPKPEPAPQPTPAPVVKAPEKQTDNVFFRLGSSAIDGSQTATIAQIAQWAKDHPTAVITLTGYADRATGNPQINLAVSERRVAAVKDALVKRGISAGRITTDAKGDTVQPFAENDKNRAVVAISEEK